jgi:hypothetical protein
MKKLVYGVVALAITVGFTGCGKYDPVPNMAKLNVKFADSKWDGKTVPKNEVCGRYNSKDAKTPRLLINNLPSTTNKIILSFSDETYTKMSNGGHGVISYKIIEGTKRIEVPSVQSETFNLPTNFKSVQSHGSARNTDGAYLAPCSGGRGNTYSITLTTSQNSKIQPPLQHIPAF